MLFLVIHTLLTKTMAICFDRLLCSQLCCALLQKQQGRPGHGHCFQLRAHGHLQGLQGWVKGKTAGMGGTLQSWAFNFYYGLWPWGGEGRQDTGFRVDSRNLLGFKVLCLVIQEVIKQIKPCNESAWKNTGGGRTGGQVCLYLFIVSSLLWSTLL